MDNIFQGGNIDLSKYGDKYGAYLTVNLECPKDRAWQDRHRLEISFAKNEYLQVIDKKVFKRKLKNHCRQLPFGPFKQAVEIADVTEMQRKSIQDLEPREEKAESTLKAYLKQSRLMLTMKPKSSYTLHTTELAYYLSKGMIVTSIEAGIEFFQCNFMQEFVDLVNGLRQATDQETLQKLLKNFLNAIFGKFIVNVFLYHDVLICTTSAKCLALLSNHRYKAHYIVGENVSVFTLKRPRLDLNILIILTIGTTVAYKLNIIIHQFIYSIAFRSHFLIGATILSLSKVRMFELVYDYLLPHYMERLSILYMDTGALYKISN